MRQTTRGPGANRRLGDDAASSMVEFAFVMVLLLTIVFGIINFGLILSFKQDMTRAAAEGARAGAVAVPATDALADATDATNEAVKGFSDRFKTSGCTTAGMSCSVTVHDCDQITAGNPSIPDCVSVRLDYDYDAEPLLPHVPLIKIFLPRTITAESVARTNS